MPILNQFKDALNEMDELMIQTDTGEKFDMHKHNLKFNEDKGTIEIDGISEVFWICPEKIAYY